MTDTMLSLIPQAQAPQRASQGAARNPVEAKQNDSDHGFNNVLKSRMEPEAKSNQALEKESQVEAKADAEAEKLTETTTDDGKALPQTGKTSATAEPAAATSDAVQTQQLSAEELAVNVLAQNSIALEELEVASSTEDTPVILLDMLQVQAVADSRPRPSVTATVSSARSELPNTAQVAIAQAVREAMTEATAVAKLQQSPGMTVQTVAPLSTGAAGLEAMAARLLVTADSASATPLQVNSAALSTALSTALPADALAATRAALPTATLDVPLRQPGWDQALSERVLWVANQKFQGVELKLNPAHLGPIEVRVQMQNDQAQISFVAQHGPVRDALEAALPRLREMFNASGFDLVDVNISQHSFAEQQHHAQNSGRRGSGVISTENEAEMGDISQALGVRQGAAVLGGVDLFA